MVPDVVQPQDHEADQRLPPPPLGPHLLQQPDHPVGPLHVIVGPDPPALRVVQIGHDLGKLLRAELLQGLDQLGHGPERRVPHIVSEQDNRSGSDKFLINFADARPCRRIRERDRSESPPTLSVACI